MSYGSFLKSLPQALRQPTGIATIASVGVHGLLWIVLPILPLASKTTESDPEPVQLVELTPAEQSRLPSFATPQLSLPPLPKTTNLFPSLPSLQSSNSLPSSSSSPYSLPLFPPPPTGFSFSAPMPLPAPLGLPITQIPIPDTLPPRPPQSPQRPQLSGEFQERPGLDLLQQNSEALQSQTLPKLEGASPDAIALSSPDSKTPDPTTEEPTTPPSAPSTNSAEPSNPPTPTQPSPTDTEQAAVPTTPPPTPGVLPNKIPAAAIAQLREAQQRQQELYAPDATGTTRETITGNLETWSRQVAEKTGKEWKPLELTPSYPPQACPRKLEGNTSLGVVVDGEGKITDGPVLIQGTGYRLLNRKAEDAVRAYEFEKTGSPQAYLVTLPFTYNGDNCAATPSEAAPTS